MLKAFTLAIVTSLALTSTASAFDAFSFSRGIISGSSVELRLVRAPSEGTVSVYDYHRGRQGALLGSRTVHAGANSKVRVSLNRRPINDVIAVFTVDGQTLDTQEFDAQR